MKPLETLLIDRRYKISNGAYGQTEEEEFIYPND